MNRNGSALITAMIAALSVGVVSAIILQQSQVTEKQTRLPRIKSSMMTVEAQMREALNQNELLKACSSGVAGCLEIDHQKLDNMAVELPGAQCATPPCGISIGNRSYTGGRLTATIDYNGTEVAVAPINIDMQPDTGQAWQQQNSTCDPATPLLVGFDANGTKRCQALPLACASGSYIRAIDPMSLTSGGVACEPFPANVSCPAGQFMVSFSWTGGSAVAANCSVPLNPFHPSALSDPTSYGYASSAPPVVSSWPTTTVTTTTTTTTTTMPCLADGNIIAEAYCASPQPLGTIVSPAPQCCTNIGICTDNTIGSLTCGSTVPTVPPVACVPDGGYSTSETCTFGLASPVVLDPSCCTGGSYCDGSQMTGTAALCGSGSGPSGPSTMCSTCMSQCGPTRGGGSPAGANGANCMCGDGTFQLCL